MNLHPFICLCQQLLEHYAFIFNCSRCYFYFISTTLRPLYILRLVCKPTTLLIRHFLRQLLRLFGRICVVNNNVCVVGFHVYQTYIVCAL